MVFSKPQVALELSREGGSKRSNPERNAEAWKLLRAASACSGNYSRRSICALDRRIFRTVARRRFPWWRNWKPDCVSDRIGNVSRRKPDRWSDFALSRNGGCRVDRDAMQAADSGANPTEHCITWPALPCCRRNLAVPQLRNDAP